MGEQAVMDGQSPSTPTDLMRTNVGACRCGRAMAPVEEGRRGRRRRFCERCSLHRRAMSYYRRGGKLMEALWALDEEPAGG